MMMTTTTPTTAATATDDRAAFAGYLDMDRVASVLGLDMDRVREVATGADGRGHARCAASLQVHVAPLRAATAAQLAPLPPAWPALTTGSAPQSAADEDEDADRGGLADVLAQLELLNLADAPAPAGAPPLAACLRAVQPPGSAHVFALADWTAVPFARTTVPTYPDTVTAQARTIVAQRAGELRLALWIVPARMSTSAVPLLLHPDERFGAWSSTEVQLRLLNEARFLAARHLRRPVALTTKIVDALASRVRELEHWMRLEVQTLLAAPDPALGSALGSAEPRLALFADRAAAPGTPARVWGLEPAQLGRAVAPFARLLTTYAERYRHLLELQTLMLTGLLQEGRAALLAEGDARKLAAATIGELVGWPAVRAGLDEPATAYWADVPPRYRALLSPLSPPDPTPLSELAPFEPTGSLAQPVAALQRQYLERQKEYVHRSLRDPQLAAQARHPGWCAPTTTTEARAPPGRVTLAAVVTLWALQLLDASRPAPQNAQDGNAGATARAASALATHARRQPAPTEEEPDVVEQEQVAMEEG